MFEPNVLNYFLVLLGGFGVVWSYRLTSKQQDKRIGEFEYAAFSTLWGIPVFFLFYEIIKSNPDALKGMFDVPMMASPILFALGAGFGYVGAELVGLLRALRKHLQK